MRVLITADLHYRPAKREVYLAFADHLRALEPDCFILAGDLGHPLRLFRRTLQLFADLRCPRLFIAGNHDLYRGEFDSRTLWQRVLPQVTREAGFIWLEDQVVRLPLDPEMGRQARRNEVLEVRSIADGCLASAIEPTPEAGVAQASHLGICGTMGWYDYSSREPELFHSDTDYKTLKRLVNHDADFIDWPWSDRAVARYLTRRFAGRLAALSADPAIHQILVVTHVPVFEAMVPREPGSDFWSLLRAYLGNFTLGQAIYQQPKVTHVVCGHVHRAGHWIVEGKHGPIEAHLVGSQSDEPRAVLLEFPAQAGASPSGTRSV